MITVVYESSVNTGIAHYAVRTYELRQDELEKEDRELLQAYENYMHEKKVLHEYLKSSYENQIIDGDGYCIEKYGETLITEAKNDLEYRNYGSSDKSVPAY